MAMGSTSSMQRMRKAVDVKPGVLFDLHSCNKLHCGQPPYNPLSSSMLIYMAHFAFLDSLWFGEGFSPNSSPEYWLVEMSGLPIGTRELIYSMHALDCLP